MKRRDFFKLAALPALAALPKLSKAAAPAKLHPYQQEVIDKLGASLCGPDDFHLKVFEDPLLGKRRILAAGYQKTILVKPGRFKIGDLVSFSIDGTVYTVIEVEADGSVLLDRPLEQPVYASELRYVGRYENSFVVSCRQWEESSLHPTYKPFYSRKYSK